MQANSPAFSSNDERYDFMDRVGITFFAAFLLVSVQTMSGMAFAQPQGSTVPERAQRVRKSGGYPTDLVIPGADPSSGIDGLPEGRPVKRRIRRRELERGVDPAVRTPPQAMDCGGLPGLGPGLGYVCLGVCIVALLIAIAAAISHWLSNRNPVLGAHGGPMSSPAQFVDPLLAVQMEDHERLAREGRYREAIRALFLSVLSKFVDLGSTAVQGLTAREVVQSLGFETLARLLHLTEVTWFGGRDAGPPEYEQARSWAVEVQARAGRGAPAEKGLPVPGSLMPRTGDPS